jgi:hypothetical protein
MRNFEAVQIARTCQGPVHLSSQRAGSNPGSRRVAMLALATISAEAEEHRVAAWVFTGKSTNSPLSDVDGRRDL